MDFNIEELDQNKISQDKAKYFFIQTFGCALVEEKKNWKASKNEGLDLVYECWY